MSESPDYCVQGSNDVFHDPPKPEISRTNAQSDVGPSNSQPSTTSTAVVGTFHRANVVFNAQRQSRASIGLPLEVLEPETPQYVPRSSQIDNPSSRLSPGTRITQIAHGPTLYTSRNADNILLHGPERAPKFGELFPGLRGGVLGAGVEEEESAKAQSSKGKGKERLYTVSDASSEAHEAQPAQESPPVDVQRLSGLLPIVSALRPGPRTGDSPIYTAGSLFPPYIPSGPGTMPDVSRVLQASAQPPVGYILTIFTVTDASTGIPRAVQCWIEDQEPVFSLKTATARAAASCAGAFATAPSCGPGFCGCCGSEVCGSRRNGAFGGGRGEKVAFGGVGGVVEGGD